MDGVKDMEKSNGGWKANERNTREEKPMRAIDEQHILFYEK
jgi:hypothetical protein